MKLKLTPEGIFSLSEELEHAIIRITNYSDETVFDIHVQDEHIIESPMQLYSHFLDNLSKGVR
jgi:hypothetical protein